MPAQILKLTGPMPNSPFLASDDRESLSKKIYPGQSNCSFHSNNRLENQCEIQKKNSESEMELESLITTDCCSVNSANVHAW